MGPIPRWRRRARQSSGRGGSHSSHTLGSRQVAGRWAASSRSSHQCPRSGSAARKPWLCPVRECTSPATVNMRRVARRWVGRLAPGGKGLWPPLPPGDCLSPPPPKRASSTGEAPSPSRMRWITRCRGVARERRYGCATARRRQAVGRQPPPPPPPISSAVLAVEWRSRAGGGGRAGPRHSPLRLEAQLCAFMPKPS
jgi:hypothetical protein